MKIHELFTTPTAGVARASAPGDGKEVPTDAGSVLAIALDVGAELLRAGGEIHRVEDTVTRICRAYGAEAVEVFAITSLITAEVRMPYPTPAHSTTAKFCSTWVKIPRMLYIILIRPF